MTYVTTFENKTGLRERTFKYTVTDYTQVHLNTTAQQGEICSQLVAFLVLLTEIIALHHKYYIQYTPGHLYEPLCLLDNPPGQVGHVSLSPRPSAPALFTPTRPTLQQTTQQSARDRPGPLL